MMVHFKADADRIARVFDKPSTLEDMAREPCLFSCDWETAKRVGGLHTKAILSKMDFFHMPHQGAVIDVRVQRLMPGMFPSIPGWHCDGVPRDSYHSQPDFLKADEDYRHFVLVQSTSTDGVSLTEYTGSEFEFNINLRAGFVYKQLHDYIENSRIYTYHAEQGALYRFSHFQPHRAVAATSRGWRMFFRLSYYHNPPIANKVESVQQVYLLSEANGW